MKYFSHFLAIFLCSIAFNIPAQASEIKENDINAGFVPHKALYDITLEDTKSGSQVVNITGQMFYEWAPDCDGWNSSHRFNLLYEYADSDPLRITSDFTTFESFDGQTLNFSSQRKHNGTLFEEVRGAADIKEKAQYSIPENVSYYLPKGTLFPIAHSMQLAQKIKSGEKFFNATIFDGSDDEGPTEINTFIGNPIENSDDTVKSDLLNAPAHKVRLAFFPLKERATTSDYEMTLDFHENSVISDMIIEYDDFTVRQKLIALEEVENTCNPANEKQ